MKPTVVLVSISSAAVLVIMHASLRQNLPPSALSTQPKISTSSQFCISIPDLLGPSTQLAAFQKYCIQAQSSYETISFSSSDPESFRKSHSDFRVTRIGTPFSPQGCIVSWYTELNSNSWSAVNPSEKKTPSDILLPHDSLQSQRFSQESLPVAENDEHHVNGLIADLNGDGKPDFIERHREVTGVLLRDDFGNVLDTPMLGIQRDYLEVRPFGRNIRPALRVLFNSHPASQAVGNTWGFQAKGPDKRGVYEIQLGPLRVTGDIEPKVTFHWDEHTKTWVSPKPAKGDHFLVLRPDENVRSAKLSYPLHPVPETPSNLGVEQAYRSQDLPIDEISHPYRYHSLAGLQNENLFDFMAQGLSFRAALDRRADQATSVPKFWRLSPRETALQLIYRNRPFAANKLYQLGFVVGEKEHAPSEGDVTLSRDPSTRFDSSGKAVHHLHCFEKGSYIALVNRMEYGFPIPLTDSQRIYDFRRMEIPYVDARQLLQTIWWLGHARSLQLTGFDGIDFMSGGESTHASASASFQFASPEESFAMDAEYSSGTFGRTAGTGVWSGDYDASAFMTLVVQLFAREVPDRLGRRWTDSGIHVRWNSDESAPDMHYTPAELERLHTTAESLFEDFRKGNLAPSVLTPIVETVADLNWKNLRPQVENLAPFLPPVFPHQKRVADLDAEILLWKEKLGAEETSEAARYKRIQQRQNVGAVATASTPSPSGAETSSPPKPLPPGEEEKLAAFDALLELRMDTAFRAPVSDRFIAELREAIPKTLQRLDCFDNVEGLYRLGLADREAGPFVTTRLAQLNTDRAIDFLKLAQKRANSEESHFYEDALDRFLHPAEKDQLTPQSRAELRAILADKDGNYDKRERALQTLASSGEPDAKFDKILFDLLTTPSAYLENTATTLARRVGAPAWSAIGQAAGQPPPGSISSSEYFAALTTIAFQEPGARASLQTIIDHQINEPGWSIRDALWSAWLLDLRELKGKIGQIANESPDDGESGLTSERKPPSTVRYHLARKIAALWNEEDPATRTRLLIAFALSESDRLAGDKLALKVISDRVSSAIHSLPNGEQTGLRSFARWCTENAPSKLPNTSPAALQEVLSVIASAPAK